MEPWQETTLDALASYLKQDKEVIALLAFGSLSIPDLPYDQWSDIDILMVVEPDAISRFFPTTDWLEAFGRVYAYDQSDDAFKQVTRVCFDDLRRIDIVITTEGKLDKIEIWPRNPLQVGTRVLFSRSQVVDRISSCLHRAPAYKKFPDEDFDRLVRQFRFKSILAVYKVARNDLLIALHLALDLVRDCAILGMVLRDRAEGSDFHKTGGIGNHHVQLLQRVRKPYSASGILDRIEAANTLFEKLAFEWSPDYVPNSQPILDWIAAARDALNA